MPKAIAPLLSLICPISLFFAEWFVVERDRAIGVPSEFRES